MNRTSKRPRKVKGLGEFFKCDVSTKSILRVLKETLHVAVLVREPQFADRDVS